MEWIGANSSVIARAQMDSQEQSADQGVVVGRRSSMDAIAIDALPAIMSPRLMDSRRPDPPPPQPEPEPDSGFNFLSGIGTFVHTTKIVFDCFYFAFILEVDQEQMVCYRYFAIL